VWFPGFGWQSFDPTAVVPLASPAPGTVALDDIGHALKRIPIVPVAGALFSLALAAAFVQWRRSRPLTWAERIARSAERAGRRAGRPRRPHETFGEYVTTLDDLTGGGSKAWRQLAVPVDASAYGGHDPTPEVQRQMVTRARRLRVGRHRDRDQNQDRDRDLHPVA
jgi:hypothetical protein